MPSVEVILLALLALAAYTGAAMLASLARRGGRASLARSAAMLQAAGISLSLATLVLRIARGQHPTASALDVFTLLALLTGAVSAYLKAVSAPPWADIVLLPLAAAWSCLAAALGGGAYHDVARDVWGVAHVALAASAAVSFAAAGAGGWLYLRKHKQLRGKDPAIFRSSLPSLERIERFLRHALPISFALVTATIVAGLAGALQPWRQGYFRNWPTHPKVLVSSVTWVLYTVALHAAYAKRFRGRAVAALAITGFALLVVVLVASMLIPKT